MVDGHVSRPTRTVTDLQLQTSHDCADMYRHLPHSPVAAVMESDNPIASPNLNLSRGLISQKKLWCVQDLTFRATTVDFKH